MGRDEKVGVLKGAWHVVAAITTTLLSSAVVCTTPQPISGVALRTEIQSIDLDGGVDNFEMLIPLISSAVPMFGNQQLRH